MDRKSFFLVVGALVVATTLLPTVRGEDGASVAAFKDSAGDRARSARRDAALTAVASDTSGHRRLGLAVLFGSSDGEQP
jgi:Sec-independent protein translocase protein TatA